MWSRLSLCWLIMLVVIIEAAVRVRSSSSGVASSIFSSRGGNKPTRPDVSNRDWYSQLDDWYDPNSNSTVDIPDEQLLIGRLLRYYDPASRPVFNASKPVIIKFGLSFIQICDMDERNQILTTNVWLEQEWLDERLEWNKSDYNNLDKIRVPCNRIWLPDIVLYNSADDYTQGYMQSKAMVKPDGEVFWPPPAKLRSSCKIDVTFFPFDDQICHLKFGSWTYSGLQVDLLNKDNNSDLTNYIKSGEWHLINIMVKRNVIYYPCCPEEPYPDVTFYIFIRRRILYYLFNIILPCIWLSILSLITFWLPPDSGEKITLGITVLLAFSVFMLLIAENIPATSETVPLIGVYLTVTMSLTSMSIVLTVFVLQLHHATQFAPEVPRGVYLFMTTRLAPLVGMRNMVERFERSEAVLGQLSKATTDANVVNQTLNSVNSRIKSEKLRNSFRRQSRHRESHSSSSDDNSDDAMRRAGSKNDNYRPKSPSNKSIQSDRKLKTRSEEELFYDMKSNKSKIIHSFSQHERPMAWQRTKNSHQHFSVNNLTELNRTNCPECRIEQNDKIRVTYVATSSHFVPEPTHSGIRLKQYHHHFGQKTEPSEYYPCPPMSPPPPAPSYAPMPNLMQPCTSKRNKVCCCDELIQTINVFSKNINHYMVKQKLDDKINSIKNEWKLMALIVDRILFWIFTVLTVVSTVFLLLIVPILKNRNLIKAFSVDVVTPPPS